MGLVTANTVGLSGLVAPKPNVQIFTSSTDWTKPAGCTRVYIECIGGGGGGGAGNATAHGGGGGGGALARGIYSAEALPSTLTITVGDAGSASTGQSGSGVSNGVAGTDSIAAGGGFTLTGYGGGGGAGGVDSSHHGAGGGGGGTGSRGATAASSTAAAGGNPVIQGATLGYSLAGGGAKGTQGSGTPPWNQAEYGGGGGDGVGGGGGGSLYGGGGGGSQNNKGGAWGAYAPATGGNVQADGDDNAFGCGDGGGGATSSGGTSGGDGGVPGGGGGNGALNSGATGGSGGAGARGEVRIFSW